MEVSSDNNNHNIMFAMDENVSDDQQMGENMDQMHNSGRKEETSSKGGDMVVTDDFL